MPLAGSFLEFHLIQSYPSTRLNCDDQGRPKTAIIGGVQRARISSQALKRMTRETFHRIDPGLDHAVRTRHLTDVFHQVLMHLGLSSDRACLLSCAAGRILGMQQLLFISTHEIDSFARFFIESEADIFACFKPLKQKKKANGLAVDLSNPIESRVKKVLKDLVQSCVKEDAPGLSYLDIALFGRMCARAHGLNVQASCAFSHALSTHAVAMEEDFFAAQEELPRGPDERCAYTGKVAFNSATYYRYVSIDLGSLCDAIGVESLERALNVFVQSLFMGQLKTAQSSFSGVTLPDYVRVIVRQGQRLQVSLDRPVHPDRWGGFVAPSIELVNRFIEEKKYLLGSFYKTSFDMAWGLDPLLSIDRLINSLVSHTKQLQD